MGLFDFFKKHQGLNHSDHPAHLEQKSTPMKQEVIDTPFGKAILETRPYPSEPIYLRGDESKIELMAIRACWKHNTGQPVSDVWRALNDLYNYVQRETGKILINLPSETCGTVGRAFAIYALCYQADNGDRDFNTVAAENAYYCLMRSYRESNQLTAVPTLFALLNGSEDLMLDRLISYRCDDVQSHIDIPLGFVLKGNPYRAPHLQGFRDEASSYRLVMMRYLLDLFYDLDTKSYKQATDMHNFTSVPLRDC